MRVVIVGASGNTGSAVLRRLVAEPTVTSIVAVASRVPRADGSSTVVPPYDGARWVRCDLADPLGDVERVLTETFARADAVVHLAWARGPERRRARLDRVDVLGTERVARAAAAAGVAQLVVASCASAYAPVGGPAGSTTVPGDLRADPPDDVPRLETWPTSGVASDPDSLAKVRVERYLDAFETAHPGVVVTRVRACLTVQRDAASALGRLLLGRLLPSALRRATASRPLPWPRGLRLQVAHADDVAEVYRALVVGRHRGPFNVGPDEVLTGADVADVVGEVARARSESGAGASGLREISPSRVRRLLAAASAARLVPAGPGCLDTALGVPVVDASRARALLHWRPVHAPRDTLAEVVEGLLDGAGAQSPPLLPR